MVLVGMEWPRSIALQGSIGHGRELLFRSASAVAGGKLSGVELCGHLPLSRREAGHDSFKAVVSCASRRVLGPRGPTDPSCKSRISGGKCKQSCRRLGST